MNKVGSFLSSNRHNGLAASAELWPPNCGHSAFNGSLCRYRRCSRQNSSLAFSERHRRNMAHIHLWSQFTCLLVLFVGQVPRFLYDDGGPLTGKNKQKCLPDPRPPAPLDLLAPILESNCPWSWVPGHSRKFAHGSWAVAFSFQAFA
jgi:hypothetical protein